MIKQKINYETYEKPTDYVQWKDGSNIIRILSDGFFIKFHEFKAGGQFVSMPCKGDDCESCRKNIESKIKYVWIVLERTYEPKVKYIKVGPMIGDAICKLGRHEDIRTFDVEIVKVKGAKVSYKVNKIKESKPIEDDVKKLIKEEMPILASKYINI